MQPPIRNPNPRLEFLKPLLNDSTKQFLAQHRTGRTDFSDFESIFTRLLQDHRPDPPLELLWFYSAVVFHSSKQDFGEDSVRLTRSLFQMLVPLSESFSAAKRAATLSPLVYNLIRLVKTRREEVSELLDAIVSYVSAYCGDEGGGCGEDDLLMVTGFSFADLSRVWVVDEAGVGDCLETFMPFVGGRLRREVGSESCSVGCLAGIVASQLLLLSLCLRFDSELRKDLRESVVQMINAFRSCYFFDGILKMLLVEPYLHLTPLLGPEDEAALLETITEAVIESAESLFLNPGSGNDQRSLQLKNIAINWLFLFAKASLRYMNMFSHSRIPYHLVNWVISQGEVIRDVDTLLNSTPVSFIEWLLSLEEQGLRVFDCDHSKNYAKTVVHWSRPDLSLEATLLKQQDGVDQDAEMADHLIVSSISITSGSSTRKRKDDKEGETKTKLFKLRHNNFQEKSRLQPFVFSDRLVNGTEVGVSDMEL
ncbi:PREDICTED: uncharacterized protein LOC106316007 isoform X2 [Brassica oleracea var. oleracea]|uniref:uncharacterized protein LOC106316007 isoform X2 n=1 Tax=Brassica oleracea var. oleracea TaxID=109376 RepID=UPI0006A6E825|nr:PREDICTED: uncharacterized protein LOC106316007 isoform X2 [Brassica oleracea var. oleracea]